MSLLGEIKEIYEYVTDKDTAERDDEPVFSSGQSKYASWVENPQATQRPRKKRNPLPTSPPKSGGQGETAQRTQEREPATPTPQSGDGGNEPPVPPQGPPNDGANGSKKPNGMLSGIPRKYLVIGAVLACVALLCVIALIMAAIIAAGKATAAAPIMPSWMKTSLVAFAVIFVLWIFFKAWRGRIRRTATKVTEETVKVEGSSWKQWPAMTLFFGTEYRARRRRFLMLAIMLPVVILVVLFLTFLAGYDTGKGFVDNFVEWWVLVPVRILLIIYIGALLADFLLNSTDSPATIKMGKFVVWATAILALYVALVSIKLINPFSEWWIFKRTSVLFDRKPRPSTRQVPGSTAAISDIEVRKHLTPEIMRLINEKFSFADDHDRWMIARICYAESGFKQYDPPGTTNVYVHPGPNQNGSYDYGLCGINGFTWFDHGRRVMKMEEAEWKTYAGTHDLHFATLAGNIGFAAELYKLDKKAGRDGFTDWNASRSLWDPEHLPESAETRPPDAPKLTQTHKTLEVPAIPQEWSKRYFANVDLLPNSCIQWHEEDSKPFLVLVDQDPNSTKARAATQDVLNGATPAEIRKKCHVKIYGHEEKIPGSPEYFHFLPKNDEDITVIIKQWPLPPEGARYCLSK